MKRGPETLDRTAGWLKQYGQRNQRYMIVPQSDNIFGWFVNLRKLLEGPAGEYTITIGVPKHMASLDSDGLGRLEILSTLHRRGYSSRHAVHLLGTDDRLQEPPHLDEFSWVRSFDSAKPAIWAYRCAMLDPRREPLAALPPFNRPDGFFDLEFPFTFLYMLNLTRWNINAVETWVRAGIPVAYGVY
jgi:hypothetical protein